MGLAKALPEPVRLAEVDAEGKVLGETDSETDKVPLCEADCEAVQLEGPHSPSPLQGQPNWQAVGSPAPVGQKLPLGQVSGTAVPLGQ